MGEALDKFADSVGKRIKIQREAFPGGPTDVMAKTVEGAGRAVDKGGELAKKGADVVKKKASEAMDSLRNATTRVKEWVPPLEDEFVNKPLNIKKK